MFDSSNVEFELKSLVNKKKKCYLHRQSKSSKQLRGVAERRWGRWMGDGGLLRL